MNTIKINYYPTKYGELILGEYNGKLCLADWRYRLKRTEIDKRIKSFFSADYLESESDLLKETISQIQAYFERERKSFDLPLIFAGSDFQQSVWTELGNIPYGETRSYLSLSKTLGNSMAIRAVAAANGANAISIIVPCHRVVGSNGELTGYAGGLRTKKQLLQLEGALANNQLDLFT